MGQKVHPIGFRLGIAKDWNSTWFAEKDNYAELLISDLEVREFLQERLAQAAVSRIQIERPAKSARITIHTARPGIVIGKKGEDGANSFYQISDKGLSRPLCDIPFQVYGVNGISIESLLAVCLDRLEGFQSGEFKCEQNEFALKYTYDALAALKIRTQDRIDRNVEGKYEK